MSMDKVELDERQFPRHAEIFMYLKRYAQDINEHIRFNESVEKVQRLSQGTWEVKTNKDTMPADVVCICNGHYERPRIPHIKGIESFSGKYMHSKKYREPSIFENKRVCILGSSASGEDLSREIGEVSESCYLIGPHTEKDLEEHSVFGSKNNIRRVPGTIYEVSDDRVQIQDGQWIQNVDFILFCTGYHYDYPFLDLTNLPDLTWEEDLVYPMYKQMFYTHDPSLVFFGLPWKIVPFSLFECQSILAQRFHSK